MHMFAALKFLIAEQFEINRVQNNYIGKSGL